MTTRTAYGYKARPDSGGLSVPTSTITDPVRTQQRTTQRVPGAANVDRITAGRIEAESGEFSINLDDETILVGEASDAATGLGVFLGLDSGSYQFRVGDPSGDYILWDGSSLNIVGTVTVGSVSWSSITGSGKPDDNADVTSAHAQNLSWLIASGIISTATLDIDASNQQIRLGATPGSITPTGGGVGVFLGLDSSAYQFRVGNPSGDQMLFDGSNLTITGTMTVGAGSSVPWSTVSGAGTPDDNADVTSAHAGDINVISASTPGSPFAGMQWADTSTTPATVKRYNGSSWDTIGTLNVDADDVPESASRKWAGESGADVTSANAQNLSWLIASGIISTATLDIDASNQQIRLGSTPGSITPTGGGAGVFLGHYSSAYQLRVGNPSGDQMLWDGSALTIAGTISSTSKIEAENFTASSIYIGGVSPNEGVNIDGTQSTGGIVTVKQGLASNQQGGHIAAVSAGLELNVYDVLAPGHYYNVDFFTATATGTAKSRSKFADTQVGVDWLDLGIGTGSVTINFDSGNVQHLDNTGSRTVTLSNGQDGFTYILSIVAGSGAASTWAWATTIKWVGAAEPTLSTTSTHRDIIFLVRVDGVWLGSYSLGHA